MAPTLGNSQRKLTERAKTDKEKALSVTPLACHLSRSERLLVSFLLGKF